MAVLKMVLGEGVASHEDFKVLSGGLLAQHAKSGHSRSSIKFNIFLKDRDEKAWGGVICTCLWNGLEIDSLWIEETLRGQGWGRKLMEEAEAEGRKRGCTFAYTNTFSWQAPDFYEKLGYREYGMLKNFPEGNNLTYFRKDI